MHWLLGETSKLNTLIPKRSLRANLRRDIGNRFGHRLDVLRWSQRRELLLIRAAEVLGLKDAGAAGQIPAQPLELHREARGIVGAADVDQGAAVSRIRESLAKLQDAHSLRLSGSFRLPIPTPRSADQGAHRGRGPGQTREGEQHKAMSGRHSRRRVHGPVFAAALRSSR